MSELTFMRKSGALITDKQTGQVFQPMAFMHYCSHPGCISWGAFGVGAALFRKNQPGAWYCRQHLPPQGTMIDA